MIGGFYEEPENSLDGVYIGSSNCFAFWNPLVAWNNYGLAVYPYASASQPFYATEYIIREARKTQPDALYIVNLNSVEEDDLRSANIHYLTNYMPDSEIKTEIINYLSGLIGYSEIERLEFRFPWIVSRDYWLDYIRNGFFPKLDGLKGANKYGKYLKTSVNIEDSYILSDGKAGIPAELEANINSLLDYCDEENVEVLFVSVPRAEKSENALERINTVSDMIQSRGYEVLYLTDKAMDIGMDLSQDYYDIKHANIHGSIKFTNFLSEYLMENYGMQSHRGDDFYSSWNDAWEIYAGGVSPAILDVELNASCRDYSLAAVQLLRAERDDDGAVCVEWEAAEGAEGYAVYRKVGKLGPWKSVSAYQEQTFYSDSDCQPGTEYFYTAIPVRVVDGEYHYGNFSYSGISISE